MNILSVYHATTFGGCWFLGGWVHCCGRGLLGLKGYAGPMQDVLGPMPGPLDFLGRLACCGLFRACGFPVFTVRCALWGFRLPGIVCVCV